jgi:dimethylglycine dehydrogenase
MKTKTKVVVVGGGVVGVSALYHLAKKGWSDVVLVERKEFLDDVKKTAINI